MARIIFSREKPLEIVEKEASRHFRKKKLYKNIDLATWAFKVTPEEDRVGENLERMKSEGRKQDNKLREWEKKLKKRIDSHERTIARFMGYRSKLQSQPFKLRESQVLKYREMRRQAVKSTRLFSEYKSISTDLETSGKRDNEWIESKKQGRTPAYSARRNLDYLLTFGGKFGFEQTPKSPKAQGPAPPSLKGWFA